MALPSGTVTFLFTDIEGSTKLWEQHPEAMKAGLAKHDSILKKTIKEGAGRVIGLVSTKQKIQKIKFPWTLYLASEMTGLAFTHYSEHKKQRRLLC